MLPFPTENKKKSTEKSENLSSFKVNETKIFHPAIGVDFLHF
jgi:hypothetical protein